MAGDSVPAGSCVEGVVAITQHVVRDPPGPLQLRAGQSHEPEHRHALRQRSHHAVDGAELTGAEGGAQHRRTSHPRVSIGRVGGVELIGRAHPLHGAIGLDRVDPRERIVTGHAEHVLDAQRCDAANDVLGNSRVRHGSLL